MEQCKSCVYYIEIEDKLFIMHDDARPIEKGNETRHYCPLFDSSVTEEVFCGEKKCEDYHPKQK